MTEDVTGHPDPHRKKNREPEEKMMNRKIRTQRPPDRTADRKAILTWIAAAAVLLLLPLLAACGKTDIPEGAVVLDGVYRAED